MAGEFIHPKIPGIPGISQEFADGVSIRVIFNRSALESYPRLRRLSDSPKNVRYPQGKFPKIGNVTFYPENVEITDNSDPDRLITRIPLSVLAQKPIDGMRRIQIPGTDEYAYVEGQIRAPRDYRFLGARAIDQSQPYQPESAPQAQRTRPVRRRPVLKGILYTTVAALGIGALTVAVDTAWNFLHQPPPDVGTPSSNVTLINVTEGNNHLETAIVRQDLANTQNTVNPVLLLTVRPGSRVAVVLFNTNEDREYFASHHLNAAITTPNNWHEVKAGEIPEVLIIDPNHPTQRDVFALILFQATESGVTPHDDCRVTTYANYPTVLPNYVNSTDLNGVNVALIENIQTTGRDAQSFAPIGNINFQFLPRKQ